jgi:hypothetical protein
MEDGLLQNPKIKEALKEVQVLWLHTDHITRGPEYRKLEVDLVGFYSSPFWVIVDPQTGKPLRNQAYTDVVATFLKFLRGE